MRRRSWNKNKLGAARYVVGRAFFAGATTMSTDTTELILPAITPAVPLVLANRAFLSTLATVEQQVAALRITDAATQQVAADLQVRLTQAGNALERERKAIKQPFLDKCGEIDAAARPVAQRIDAAKNAVRTAITNFALEQQRIAAEAERARQAELRRLEAIRLEEQRKAREKADELARIAAKALAEREAAAAAAKAANAPAPAEIIDMGDDCPDEPAPKTETEKAIEKLAYTPAPVVAKPVGVTFRTRLVLKVVDVAKVPDVFVVRTANEKAIAATYCTGWKEGMPLPTVPGCEFVVEKTPVSTGRTF